MALIAGANGGGGARGPSWTQPVDWRNPYRIPPGARRRPTSARDRLLAGEVPKLTPQQVNPYATPWSPRSFIGRQPTTRSPAQYWPSMDAEIAAQVDVAMGRTAPQPTWQPTAPGPGPPGAPSPIAPPAAPPIPPGFSDWANLWSPIRESGGGPWDFLKLRPSDWRAMPEGIRGELEEWLRALGWRPGGRWGQFGALDWTRDQPTGERGAAWGAEAFSGLSESVKPWLWFLYNRKWGDPTAARPETQGWSWA